ncbi:MAG: hypothetical protein K2L07_13030 [Lachnospiraceae bacterium]|nr:hypothetical protein [Lachnospiraceae bacterium]
MMTNLVGFSGKVAWNTVTNREIFELSELMFDAAEAPQAARNDFYIELTSFFYKLIADPD